MVFIWLMSYIFITQTKQQRKLVYSHMVYFSCVMYMLWYYHTVMGGWVGGGGGDHDDNLLTGLIVLSRDCQHDSLPQQWHHNGQDGISNHQLHNCLVKHLFRHWSKKHKSSMSLAFVRGIHPSPVNSPNKRPVTRKMFWFDDVIMSVASGSFNVAVMTLVTQCLHLY